MVLSGGFEFLCYKIIKEAWIFPVFNWMEVIPEVRTGGESVGYQGRKSSKTSNCIFLCDNQGQMLSLGDPMSGEHHDLYNIEETLKEILSLLKEANIEHTGLFLNADSGKVQRYSRAKRNYRKYQK